MGNFRPLPPLEELQEVLSYDPKTGVIIWKVKPNRSVAAGAIAGTTSGKGYRMIRLGKHRFMAHRLAWLFETREDPGAYTIDHINRNKDDNRIENLRLATHQQQRGNQPMCATNTSGFKGVFWNKQRKKWLAQIRINRKQKYLGLFATKEEAAEAYQKAAASHYGEFMAS